MKGTKITYPLSNQKRYFDMVLGNRRRWCHRITFICWSNFVGRNSSHNNVNYDCGSGD